jgi:hypothetical protein
VVAGDQGALDGGAYERVVPGAGVEGALRDLFAELVGNADSSIVEAGDPDPDEG